MQWQNSLPFPALLWFSQLREIGIIAPCTSGLSIFLRWIYVQLFAGIAGFSVSFIPDPFSSLVSKSSARNHRSSLHFAGVRLFSNQFNSVGLFVRNQFAGWKMNAWVTRQAVVKWKIPRWNRVAGFVLRWLFHYRHTNSQITTNSNSFAALTGRHYVPPFN